MGHRTRVPAVLIASALVAAAVAGPPPPAAASTRTVASSTAATVASSPRTVTRVDSWVHVTPDSTGRVTVPYCPATDPCAFASTPAAVVVTGRGPTGGRPGLPLNLVAYNRSTSAFTLRALDQSGTVITTAIDVYYHAASSLTGSEEVRTVAVTTDADGYATVGYASSHGAQAATAVVASGVSPDGGPDMPVNMVVSARTGAGFTVRALNQSGAKIVSGSVTFSYYAAWAGRVDYGNGWVAANATTTVSTDAGGYATVSFAPPLPSTPTGIVAVGVAPAGGGYIAASLLAYSPTANSFRLRVLNQNGAGVPSQSVTLSYHAVAAVPDFSLFQPDTLHSNGADLSWSKYTGTLSGQPFAKYEVHRSTTPNFTPSASTLLMSTTDIATTSYRDTTAAPGGIFYYKVVANSTASQEFQVTLPADGQATKLLQPDPAAGKDTKLFYEYFASGDVQCGTYGTEDWLRVGSDTGTTKWRTLIRFDLKDIPRGSSITSASMSLWKIASNAAATVSAYRVSRDWVEGSYGCFNGATWYTAANGVNWTANGGDYDQTAVTSRSVPAGEAEGWHNFTITSAAQAWVNGDKPNLGLLLRLSDESGTVKNDIDYASSDRTGPATEISHRPKLAVTYTDGSHAVKPTVSVASPAGGATVRGTTAVTAAASDDRRVERVEFYQDGGTSPIGTVNAAPWTFSWATTGLTNGTHTLTAKAYDDAGNSTTSAVFSAQVANYPAPSTAITSPANNATGLTGTVTVTTSNTVASGLSVSKVELYVDGALYQPSTTSPYSFPWNTLDPALPAYDGSSHTLQTKVYDSSGQAVSSPVVTVSTGNTTGTRYIADFASTPVPQAMTYTPGGPQLVYPVDVTVTNKNAVGWSSATTFLRYRWYSPNPADQVVESGNIAALGLAAGVASAPVRVNVTPPTLPDGVDAAQYRLRFDVFDTSTSPATAFASKGNNPSENPVVINKALSTKLGIEKYYSYVTTPVGAGMTNVVNVANGNSMLTLTPLSNPGRGLHTVARLTYNSLEEKSESPVGTNFSLSISSLVRFGNPLDVHPNNADLIAGRSNKFVTFVDGDGSLHRFDGVTGADGVTFWKEPPGVHLYLRSLTTDENDPRYWALTRPDRVTFYFNSKGYPTFVTDRNGNTISFTLTAVAPGDDPGGPKFHVTKVTDASGQGLTPAQNRSFDITYFTKATARKPQIRGKISRITDHLGHAVEFAYYDDGNLLQVTEKGGSNADGTPLADRAWSFTYTTSDGSGPATNPNSQSSLIYSVRDPLGHDTLFGYNGPGTNQNRWKLASVTDRANHLTTFGYDITNRVTTVAAPTPAGQTARTTKYGYDTDGKPVSITNPLSQVTALEWNSDFAVTKRTEPNLKTRRFDYNDNGYLTDVYDQLDNHTVLTYENLPAGSNDIPAHWRPGRTIPHLSQLATKQDPVDVAAGSTNRWSFDYDTKGNLTTVTEPLYPTTPARYTYNADGTVATSADFKGNVSTLADYDDNGLPTTIVDATDNPTAPAHPTRMKFDTGGRLLWVQDPGHAPYSSSDARARTSFYYDSFNRLGRQSTPKSTSRQLGELIWSDIAYDANDNTVKVIAPHYGAHDSGTGDTTAASYDVMDRQTLVTGPDTSADSAGERTRLEYDEAGRVKTVTLPLGVKNGTPNNTRTINNSYDALDQTVKQTRYHQKADGSIETLTQHGCYDTVGNLVSTTAPKAALASVTCPAAHTTPYTTVYGYDDAHQMTSVSDPLSHNTVFDYDANGNRRQVTDAAGNATILRYDSLNRLTRTEEPYLTGATPRSVVTVNEYDANGNRARLISPRAYDASTDKTTFTSYVTKFNYDALNRLTRVDLPTDSTYPTAYYVHRGYDVNGNLTVSTLPDTHPNLVDVPATAKTLVEYFDPGWIAASNDPANPKVHFDYNPRGQQTLRTPETRAGDLDTDKQIQWAYSADGLLQQRTDQKGQQVTYTYDADNQLLTSHDGSGLTTPTETAVDTVNGYDDLDRLIRSDHKKQADQVWRFSTSGYDANGNLTDTEQD
ncbi:MAG TPA: Ig-like domain-containing protein, partial [Mycobacteriales bacterium]|nr:Ig-like domain-containing protein [Mycobacteriales bacterium]